LLFSYLFKIGLYFKSKVNHNKNKITTNEHKIIVKQRLLEIAELKEEDMPVV